MEDEHQSVKPKEKLNLIAKSKEWLFSGLKNDETDGIEKRNVPTDIPHEKQSSYTMNTDDKVVPELPTTRQELSRAKEQTKTESSLRENKSKFSAEKEEKKEGKTWTSWIFGR